MDQHIDSLFMLEKKRIAIIGGGPAGLFLYKTLLDSSLDFYRVDIFETSGKLGMGMPYSSRGANAEHITNVSGNEVPALVTTVLEWVKAAPESLLKEFNIDRDTFHEFEVLPRLLFGEYLRAQFELLRDIAKAKGIETRVCLNTTVTDVTDLPSSEWVMVECDRSFTNAYNQVFICTGHHWPVSKEGKTPGYFDSPYPPVKLLNIKNQQVAIRGSGLTAIDAVRTIARNNGSFVRSDNKTYYLLNGNATNFKMTLHSTSGLLPAVRFHLEDPTLSTDPLISESELNCHIRENDGFLSLDFIFEKDFKEVLKVKDPDFYAVIKNMTMEQFVEAVMNRRERKDAFELFKEEYKEAAISIKKHQSVYWKELLAILSFAMNYPAKHFSAEDMLRLQKTLMPLISVIIAFVPQNSCEEMIALHDAGLLDLITVDENSVVEGLKEGGVVYNYTDINGDNQSVHFSTFVDAIGQPHLSKDDICFPALLKNRSVSAARLRFRDKEKGAALYQTKKDKVMSDEAGNFFLNVPGIAITDSFNIVNEKGEANPRIFMMAVPYIGGFNPDYSGLDFCEAASAKIVAEVVRYDQEKLKAEETKYGKLLQKGRA